MRRPTSQQSSFRGVLISLGIVLLIVFVFSQLPDNRAISPAHSGYPAPDRPISPTALPATASLEAIPSWKATEIAIAQWLATYSPPKATAVAEGEATHAAEATEF